MVAAQAQALVVVVDPLTLRYRERIIELTIKNRLPTMYGVREFAEAGESWPTECIFPTCIGVPPLMWTKSSRVPSPPICPLSNRPEDREGARPHDPADAACLRRRGDRVGAIAAPHFVGFWPDTVAKVESCSATNFSRKQEAGDDHYFVYPQSRCGSRR